MYALFLTASGSLRVNEHELMKGKVAPSIIQKNVHSFINVH